MIYLFVFVHELVLGTDVKYEHDCESAFNHRHQYHKSIKTAKTDIPEDAAEPSRSQMSWSLCAVNPPSLLEKISPQLLQKVRGVFRCVWVRCVDVSVTL